MTLELKSKFCSPSYERIVLSYCFKDVNNFYEITSKLTELDFLLSDHQLLFMVMKAIITAGATTIDLATILSYAQRSGILDALGGASYVQSIANIDVSEGNLSMYLDEVNDASTKYRLYASLNKHLQYVESNAFSDLKGMDLVSTIESDLLDMSIKTPLIEEPKSLSDGLLEFINNKKDKPILLSGISSGFPIFDKLIDGLTSGALHIIAARKKMGKSTFLTNIALFVACKLGLPVLYIDTELKFEEWRTRALARLSGVKERKIKHGTFSNQEYTKLCLAAKLIANSKIYHKYMPGYTIANVLSLSKKFKIKDNIGLLVFDYLKEPEKTSEDSYRKEYQILGDATTKLKDLAGILDIPILTAVQLNRSNDIADSDKIARYGDIVAWWSPRTEEERQEGGPTTCGNFKLCIRDTRRGGSTGEKGIGFWFFKEYLHIREVSPSEQYFISLEEDDNSYGDTDTQLYAEQVGSSVF